jgi:hypothetical protein
VGQILDFLEGAPDVHITRCRLDSRSHCDGNLSLQEIDRGKDLGALLRDCGVEKLVVEDCPDFGDEVLNAMILPNQWTFSYCARHVEDLSILDCPNFSISTLKEVVETRRIQSIRSDPDNKFGRLAPPIYTLRLSGRVPDVSPEDRDWFEGCLSKIFYIQCNDAVSLLLHAQSCLVSFALNFF